MQNDCERSLDSTNSETLASASDNGATCATISMQPGRTMGQPDKRIQPTTDSTSLKYVPHLSVGSPQRFIDKEEKPNESAYHGATCLNVRMYGEWKISS